MPFRRAEFRSSIMYHRPQLTGASARSPISMSKLYSPINLDPLAKCRTDMRRPALSVHDFDVR